ncbi:hypothetical protein [Polaromonas sp. OV174]|uniref:hypothetical protein n=1 Tax=Polaromonas sp. OV174 TaxID=1855300 RepID=UPI000B86BCE7
MIATVIALGLTHLQENAKDRSLLSSIVFISFGAALGALLRWQMDTKLNTLFPFLPPGTLVANLVGG